MNHRMVRLGLALVVMAAVGDSRSCMPPGWRAQPPFDGRDPATYVGPYSYALGRVFYSESETPVLWRPPSHVGQTGRDTALWSPGLIGPLLRGGPQFLPRRFHGVCGEGTDWRRQKLSGVYDVELMAPTETSSESLVLEFRVRYSPVEAPCDTSWQLPTGPEVHRFHAWRNEEGRWRVDNLPIPDSTGPG
jgi:hypothetical protein